ncbi:MAG: hypothetical protein AB1847_21135 [bacterium]
MNELDKDQGKRDFFNFLVDVNKCFHADYADYFFRLSDVAKGYARILTIIKKIVDYREEEERQKKKRLPFYELYKKIEDDLNTIYARMEIHPDADIVYFPGSLWIDGFFHDTHAKSAIYEMLDPKFKLPDNLEDDLKLAVHCSLGIAGAFHSLACGSGVEIPVAILLFLYDHLNNLIEKTTELLHAIEKRELLGDRNSKNASSVHLKINKIKLSDQYPKLKRVLSNFDGTQEGKTAIDRIVSKIIKTRNEKTLRKYRQYLLNSLDEEKQEVNL